MAREKFKTLLLWSEDGSIYLNFLFTFQDSNLKRTTELPLVIKFSFIYYVFLQLTSKKLA